jgi:hypothetical protein
VSYDVELKNAGPVELFAEGGTQVMGGSTAPELNVTYNYSEVYQLFDFNLKDLDGRKAKTVTGTLERLVKVLGTKTYKDYWAPTPGNAGAALARLLTWAKQYPDATFEVR